VRIGSLFAGIGGLELGLERAGVGRTIWQVERDEYCRKILERHWPDATRYDDVCTVGAHNLAPVDVVCGGFPCQDLSYAGKGAGLSGERSGLWSEFARIVRELRPHFVVVENVPALLARGLGVVLGDLAACGYDATWDCIPAAAVGAPHLRYRLFIVAYAASVRRAASECQKTKSSPWQTAMRSLREQSGSCAWWTSEPPVGRVADGFSDELARDIGALGNAVVPQVAEVVGRVLLGIAASCSAKGRRHGMAM
jgi:DNA (cytosine-5)-methyltransferase 1